MKFLCVPCDEPMKLVTAPTSDRGSLTVLYGCPKCDYQMAMLTNPFETQVVGSLGVKVGPNGGTEKSASKCPFANMVQDQLPATAVAELATPASGEVQWTAEANTRLDNVPEFARPMARTGIEKFAQDRGLSLVDVVVLDEAKEFFGM